MKNGSKTTKFARWAVILRFWKERRVGKTVTLALRASLAQPGPFYKRRFPGPSGQFSPARSFLKAAFPWPFGPVWPRPGLFLKSETLDFRASSAQTRLFFLNGEILAIWAKLAKSLLFFNTFLSHFSIKLTFRHYPVDPDIFQNTGWEALRTSLALFRAFYDQIFLILERKALILERKALILTN